jgi:hypothetical protein
MQRLLPSTPLSLAEIFQKSMRINFSTLSFFAVIVLLMVALKDYPLYFKSLYLLNSPVQLTIDILTVMLMIYLWAVSFYISVKISEGIRVLLSQAFLKVLRKTPEIYLACFIYIIIWLGLYYFAEFLSHIFVYLGLKLTTAYIIAGLFFWAFPFFIFFVLSLFAIPILISEEKHYFRGVWQAFYESISLVYGKHWFAVFIIYIVLGVWWILISSYTHHGHILAMYHLNLPFDFIVSLFFLPFFNMLVVLVLHNFRLKQH